MVFTVYIDKRHPDEINKMVFCSTIRLFGEQFGLFVFLSWTLLEFLY